MMAGIGYYICELQANKRDKNRQWQTRRIKVVVVDLCCLFQCLQPRPVLKTAPAVNMDSALSVTVDLRWFLGVNIKQLAFPVT